MYKIKCKLKPLQIKSLLNGTLCIKYEIMVQIQRKGGLKFN